MSPARIGASPGHAGVIGHPAGAEPHGVPEDGSAVELELLPAPAHRHPVPAERLEGGVLGVDAEGQALAAQQHLVPALAHGDAHRLHRERGRGREEDEEQCNRSQHGRSSVGAPDRGSRKRPADDRRLTPPMPPAFDPSQLAPTALAAVLRALPPRPSALLSGAWSRERSPRGLRRLLRSLARGPLGEPAARRRWCSPSGRRHCPRPPASPDEEDRLGAGALGSARCETVRAREPGAGGHGGAVPAAARDGRRRSAPRWTPPSAVERGLSPPQREDLAAKARGGGCCWRWRRTSTGHGLRRIRPATPPQPRRRAEHAGRGNADGA